MSQLRIWETLSLVAVLLLVTGCNSTKFSSGVEPEKELDELTVIEQAQYCEALDAFVTDADMTEMVRSIACRSMGIMALMGQLSSTESPFGSSDGSCEDVYEQCMTATDLEGFEPPEFPCVEGDWESCNITVGELEACITELTELLVATEDFLSCDLMSMASSASTSTFESMASVQSCMAVATGCAGFIPTVETDLDGEAQ